MKTLGGALFVYNGVKFDYCFEEAIEALMDLCDQVCIVVVKSDDGTEEKVRNLCPDKIIVVDEELWNATHGKEKLSYFSNIAIANLDTDYVIYGQADEIFHENSFDVIRKAIEEDKEGFMCTRYNLWRDPFSMLRVEGSRNPCSPQVIRLAKRQYRCIDDAESIGVPSVSFDYVDKIEIFHLGFVRHRDVMKAKVRHMQEKVFEMDYDKRIDEYDVFNPMQYFNEEDLVPIPKALPKYVQEWAVNHML